MIHRDYQEPNDKKWFKKWKARAAAETAKAISEYLAAKAANRKAVYKFKDTIWKDYKDHLQALFGEKCAYCEAQFLAVSFGDVEHYRPKGGVKEEPTHPGYYWLAYDPENLLPSCTKCNAGHGKGNQFPLSDPANRVFIHGIALIRELPLLLNPYVDRPEDHLTFDAELGTVQVRNGSVIGEASIRGYQLDREPLDRMRRSAQTQARNEVKLAMLDMVTREDSAACKAKITECYSDLRPFAAAVRAALNSYFSAQSALFSSLASSFQAGGT
jgi:hypothetical protein